MSEPRPVVALPNLAELTQDPTALERLPLDTLLRVQQQLGHLRADVDAAVARQLVHQHGAAAAGAPEPDRLLTADEAAQLAGVTPSWLGRRVKRLPFARKLSHKVVRFSEAGLRRWLAARRP